MINETSEKPDIFGLLEAQEKSYMKELQYLIDNHDKISTVEGLDRTKKVFDSIRQHLEHQDSLTAYKENFPEIQKSIADYKKATKEIKETLDRLVMLHVDETDFLINLVRLLSETKQLAELEEARLYRKLRQFVRTTDLQTERKKLLDDIVVSK